MGRAGRLKGQAVESKEDYCCEEHDNMDLHFRTREKCRKKNRIGEHLSSIIRTTNPPHREVSPHHGSSSSHMPPSDTDTPMLLDNDALETGDDPMDNEPAVVQNWEFKNTSDLDLASFSSFPSFSSVSSSFGDASDEGWESDNYQDEEIDLVKDIVEAPISALLDCLEEEAEQGNLEAGPGASAHVEPQTSNRSNDPTSAIETNEAANLKASNATLPTGLRFIEELALHLHLKDDLPQKSVDFFLKSFNHALDRGFLRLGEVDEPEIRLPETVRTMLNQTGLALENATKYAVCPNSDCQKLLQISLLPLDSAERCITCQTELTREKKSQGPQTGANRHCPKQQYAHFNIESQLKELLSRPDIKTKIKNHRAHLRRSDRPAGQLEDIQDGKVWKTLEKDGKLILEDEGGIGLILMCDWFKPTSFEGANNSVGVLSLVVANLPPEIRNCAENKILVGVLPGPHEADVHSIHNFLEPMVKDLLHLWDEGFCTEENERIYAALILSACDAPAARKVGGTASHSATYPCTTCWCSISELHEFDKTHDNRNRKEHIAAARAYHMLKNKSQREAFLRNRYKKDYPGGYRPSALLKLPYWDSAIMTVTDPMHNLFLGLVNWQFRTVWINMKHLREKNELVELQSIIASTTRPRHCGRPPNKVGTKSGGSLSADQFRSLVSIDFPVAIPVIWEKIKPRSRHMKAHEKWAQAIEQKRVRDKAKQYIARVKKAKVVLLDDPELLMDTPKSSAPAKRRKAQSSSSSKKRKGKRVETQGDNDSEDNSETDSSNDARDIFEATQPLEPDVSQRCSLSWRKPDAENLLRLSSAIKYLCKRTVSAEDVRRGQAYLIEYLKTSVELRGSKHMTPNHHFATHISEQILLFGPVYQFWTYTGERLNYLLKHTNNNNHTGGERELTYAKMFQLRKQHAIRQAKLAQDTADQLSSWANLALQQQLDARGTANLERYNANVNEVTHALRKLKPRKLNQDELAKLAQALKRLYPSLPFRTHVYEAGDDPVLSHTTQPVTSIRLRDGRSFSASSIANGIVKARVHEPEHGGWVERVGEITDIWQHTVQKEPGVRTYEYFARMRWYQRSTIWAPRCVSLWSNEFSHLDIEIHPRNQYLEDFAVIPMADVVCCCARSDIELENKLLWSTIGIDRVGLVA